MKPTKQHPEREISPLTEKHFYYAHSHEIPLWWSALLFVNFYTDRFRFFPMVETEYSVPWWELKTATVNVNITRIYWLRFGAAYVRETERVKA